jgi:hypothetical protein
MTQFLSRFGAAILIWVILVVLLIVSFNCMESPLAPVAPSSDIQLSIPILDKRKYVDEMMSKDTAFIKRDLAGGYYFIDKQNPAPNLIPLVSLTPPPSYQKTEVGQFAVDAIPAKNINLTLSDLGLTPVDFPGSPPFPSPSPATYVSLSGDTIDRSPEFDFVSINSGTLTLSFNNNLPLRMGFNRPITLRNNQFVPFVDTSVIATYIVGTIDSFSTFIDTKSLAGKTIRAQMKFDSISFSTEQRSTSFSLKSSNGINVQFFSSKLIADSAKAKIPDQQVLTAIEDSVLAVADSMVVRSAEFKSGLIQVRIVNNLDIDVGIKFSIDEFKVKTKGGIKYSIDTTMAGKQTMNIPIDFTTIKIEPNSLAQKGTDITFSIGITTLNSHNQKKTVLKTDYVEVSLNTLQSMALQAFTGKITPQYQFINQTSFVNFGEAIKSFKPDSLKFDSVRIDLGLKATAGFVTKYDLKLIGKNSITGKSVTINIPKDSLTGTQSIVSKTILMNNSSGWAQGFLDKLFAVVPDSLTVTGLITVNPNGINNSESSIYDSSKTYTTMDIYFPVKFGIYGGKITDTVKTEFPKDLDNIVKGQINLEIYNRIPLQFAFKGTFLNRAKPSDPYTTLFSIPLDGSTRKVNPAPINGTGVANDSALSVFSFTLDNASIGKLTKADSVFFIYNMDIETSKQGTQIVPVRIQGNDFIRLRGSGNMVYTINKQ